MENYNILKDLYENYIRNKFHTPQGLIMSFLATFLFLLVIHSFIKDDFNYEWCLYASIFIFLIFCWVIFRFFWPYKKNKKDKTGLIISIFAENYEGVKMKNKFIKELQRQIIDNELNKYFEIIPLLNHQAEKIKIKEDVDKIHKKIKGHIYFYGDVQKEYDGKDNKKYFLNVDGYVKHLPIPIPISQELSFDFRALLPKEIEFNEFFELRGCKATAKIMYLTTKYVIGVASFLSGNPFLAFDMHKNLVKELSDYDIIDRDKTLKKIAEFDFKKIRNIKNKIPLIISNETSMIAKIYYVNNLFDKFKEYINISLEYNPNNYHTWSLKSIFEFEVNNRSDASFECIKKAKQFANGKFEWMYNWAFIKFWEGQYEDAYKMCQKISQISYPNEKITLEEVEQFNLDILKEKNVPQLYFWLGFLNYKKIANLPKALDYFEKFINGTHTKSMEYLVEKAKSFLISIRKEMDLIV